MNGYGLMLGNPIMVHEHLRALCLCGIEKEITL